MYMFFSQFLMRSKETRGLDSFIRERLADAFIQDGCGNEFSRLQMNPAPRDSSFAGRTSFPFGFLVGVSTRGFDKTSTLGRRGFAFCCSNKLSLYDFLTH